MEQLEVKGLVVRVSDYKEYDQILTLLTETEGKILISGKGLKSLKSPHIAACQLFAYSRFIIKKTKAYYYIVESELIECFFELRNDFHKFALASYLCDVAGEMCVEGMSDPDLLRLSLNTLYALAKKNIPLWQIKGAFEIRIMSDEGYQPNLVSCDVCNCYTADTTFLDIMNGRLLCSECKYTEEKKETYSEESEGIAKIYYSMTPPVLEALRFIIYSPMERYLSFNLEDNQKYSFQSICEAYLLHHLEHSFETLHYYKQNVK